MRPHRARVTTFVPTKYWQKEKNQLFVHPSAVKSNFKGVGGKSLEDEITNHLPGLQRLLNSRENLAVSIIWLVIISCSFSVCCYQIFDRLQFFLSFPIESRVTLTRNETVKFPSITICSPVRDYVPLIPLKRQLAQERNVDVCDVLEYELLSVINISTLWDMMNTDGSLKSVFLFSRSAILDIGSVTYLDGSPLQTSFGSCKTFSMKTLVPFNKKDVLLYAEFYEPLNRPVCSTRDGNARAMFAIHDDGEDLTYKFWTAFMNLPFRFNMVYGVSAKRYKLLNRKEAPCVSNDEVNQCERNCIERFLRTRVNCSLPFMRIDEIPPCSNISGLEVAFRESSRLALTISYSKNCSCPARCDQTVYVDNVKTLNFDKTAVSVYFDDDVIDVIEEVYSYTFIPLVCDIGGNLGLFLGLSILTIIDSLHSIVVYFIKRVITRV